MLYYTQWQVGQGPSVQTAMPAVHNYDALYSEYAQIFEAIKAKDSASNID
eukprot:COSAG02_NODE_7675_length_2899_cov_3.344286_4_plen_50_part_00